MERSFTFTSILLALISTYEVCRAEEKYLLVEIDDASETDGGKGRGYAPKWEPTPVPPVTKPPSWKPNWKPKPTWKPMWKPTWKPMWKPTWKPMPVTQPPPPSWKPNWKPEWKPRVTVRKSYRYYAPQPAAPNYGAAPVQMLNVADVMPDPVYYDYIY